MDNDGMLIEAHIADIHFGAMNPIAQYNLLQQFEDKLKSLPILDIVSINGDIFHSKYMANSTAISTALTFITDLINICIAKDATLIIIAGTYSHDADQIKLFYPLAAAVSDKCDIRIIEEAQFINVKGKRILCIPELYGKGADYYTDFLYRSGFYDACYMHGTYVGSIYGKDIPDLNSEREPVFCMEHFANCHGPIISGHVHNPGCFDSHFYYCGSPYRWSFADTMDSKGFYWLLHDIKHFTYAIIQEPIISEQYLTINLDDLLQSDPKKVIDYVAEKQREGIHHIRIEFTKNNPENLNLLETYYRNNKEVSILNNYKKQEIVNKTREVETKYSKYQYLFDNNLTPIDKLVKYINDCEQTVFVTSEDMMRILKDL